MIHSFLSNASPLNREVGDQWIVGTHSSEGLEGLVVIISWSSGRNPPRNLCMLGKRISSVIEPLLQNLIDIHSDKSSVLDVCKK